MPLKFIKLQAFSVFINYTIIIILMKLQVAIGFSTMATDITLPLHSIKDN